ncbi:EndoS/ChiA family endoglycosidase [Bifidobacterium sp. 7101]|uniref:EndoS/ChiA family endoglycosidase n=1 Tax=Bifidobacterium sp. 7101 TaxID=1394175 RepID=UPI0012DCE12C|nr:hypothetical protein [Bifidobacterium sp. 7101]
MSNEAEDRPGSNHESDEPKPILAGYYRAWRDNCGKPREDLISLGDVPADLDLVSIITNGEVDNDFWLALPSYIEKLHAQGTQGSEPCFWTASIGIPTRIAAKSTLSPGLAKETADRIAVQTR